MIRGIDPTRAVYRARAVATEFRLVTTPEDLALIRAFRTEMYASRYAIDPTTWEEDDGRDAEGHVFLARLRGQVMATVRLLPVSSGLSELAALGLLPLDASSDESLAEGGRLAARPTPAGMRTGLIMQVWAAEWTRHHTRLRNWIAWSRRDLLRVHARVGARVLAGPVAVPRLGPGEFLVVGGKLEDVAVRGRALGCGAVADAARSASGGAAVVMQ